MPDPPKPDPRAVELMKRLRIMERWKEDAWAHGKGGTEALCALLKGRQNEKMERLMAAQMLGYAKTNLRAQQCLAEVAITCGEDPEVRWTAMFALNSIGGPYAMSAIATVFINTRRRSCCKCGTSRRRASGSGRWSFSTTCRRGGTIWRAWRAGAGAGMNR